MTAHAQDFIADATTALCDELDNLITRLTAPTPVLRIVREHEGLPTRLTRWAVLNTATGKRMTPFTDNLGYLLRFGVTFAERHPEAVLDESFGLFGNDEHSVRVDEPTNVVQLPVKAEVG